MIPLIMFIFGVALLDEDGKWSPRSVAGIVLTVGAVLYVILSFMGYVK